MTSRPSPWPPQPHRTLDGAGNPGPVRLVVGGGVSDRTLDRAEQLLLAYRTDDGLRYLDYEPVSHRDRLATDDLAVTILINSRVGPAAWKSVQDNAGELHLDELPDLPLELTNEAQRQRVAELIATVASWPGFAASVATKVLHKKRPALIPILDNEAIFGAYMKPGWPQQRSDSDSIYAVTRIRDGLDRIHHDLTRPENEQAWPALRSLEPKRSRIQLFDMIWWSYFRSQEPAGSLPR